MQVGLLNLPKFDAGSFYVAAAGAQYSHTLYHPLWHTGREKQDSVTLDVSILASKILDYSDVAGDSYTLLPIIVTGRYNWLFTEDAGVFVYGGLLKPLVLSTSGEGPSISEASAILGSFQLALGVGAFYQVGPQWFLRVDVGIEQLSAGLALRF